MYKLRFRAGYLFYFLFIQSGGWAMPAVYRDVYDCRGRIRANPPTRRSNFMGFARYAMTEQPLENREGIPTLRAVGRSMGWRWAE